MSARRYVIHGAGAVGGAIAGLLCRTGVPVVAIARGAMLDALRAGPLRVEMPSRLESVRLDVVDSPRAVRFGASDVAVLCMKSQDLGPALEDLRGAAPPSLPVVCAQNGVSACRLAVGAGFERVYGMIVYAPASYLEPGRVTLHSEPVLGVLDVGRFPTGTDALAATMVADLRRAGFVAHVEARVLRLQYGKLLTNVGNALQALAGPAAFPLFARVQAEAEAVYRAAGIEFAPLDEITARYGEVRDLPVGGQKRRGGSTWQSLARGTGSIETEWLNGDIVRLAAEAGVEAPLSSALVSLSRRATAERWPPEHLSVAELEAQLAVVAGDTPA